MWSAKTSQCVSTVNCLQDGIDSRPQGRMLFNSCDLFHLSNQTFYSAAQSNALCRSSSTTICAYLCYSMGSEFVTIQTQWDGATNYSMIRVKVIKAPQYDLVDFEVNDHRIWGLWCNPQGEYNISSYSFAYNGSWISAAMEPPPDRCIVIENGCDPKQIYCSYIFHPGKFQRSVIDQALMVLIMPINGCLLFSF